MFADEVQYQLVGGKIASLSQTVGEITVLKLVEIVVMHVDVEETVRAQTVRLADLKMETDFLHGQGVLGIIVFYKSSGMTVGKMWLNSIR